MDKHFKIDFVITWVDQNDSSWREKIGKYKDGISNSARFRDYGTLKYLLRSIDKFAPWVNKVYLVTDNQIPKWINLEFEKLKIVDHRDIIPEELLPTFNSNVIDLNLVNIKGLSEHFVYFNDDMYLNNPVTPNDFFDDYGKPMDTFGFNVIMPTEKFDHTFVNNIAIINKDFNKKEIIRKNFFKLFNIKNRIYNFTSALLAPFPRFTRFIDPHVPISFRKSTIKKVNEKHEEILRYTKHRFRDIEDYSIWIYRYYELVEGNFSVRNSNFVRGIQLSDLEQKGINIIRGKVKIININDKDDISMDNFEKLTNKLKLEFERKFSQKSNFEK